MKFLSAVRPAALCALLLVLTGPLTGCEKIKALVSKKPGEVKAPVAASGDPAATPAPDAKPASAGAAAATPGITVTGPTPAPTPVKPTVDRSAAVMVLCYHRFEDRPRDALAITPAQFEQELQAIKDNGFTVVGMQDFLAFRRGEKSLPAKSCIITIDDGYLSGYEVAWPLLKKFGYPFTMFVYVNYIGSGGKSVSWDQLAEMRDAGVDIQSHTYSHSNLKAPGTGVDKKTADGVRKDIAELGREGWLKKEIAGSKEVLEKQLGIRVNALAYPFGIHSQEARDMLKTAGYEAGFTVYGQRLGASSPAFDLLGRYAIDSGKPQIFTDALKMIGGGGGTPAAGPSVAQLATASMITEPMDGATITNPSPTIKANLATMGDVDPTTLEVRVSGVGQLAAKYDAPSKLLTAPITQKLVPGTYTVIISGKVNGTRAETRWSFTVGK